MKPRFKPMPGPGFTLVEVVISLALVSILLTAAYLCFSAGIVSRKLVESRSDAIQTARVALDLMAADLRCATPLGPDFAFVGMARELDGAPADNVDFATHHYTPAGPGEADWCEVSYFVERNPDTDLLTLWRRRDATPDAEPLDGGSREEIAPGILGLGLEYFDGLDWYADWGETRPPEAVATGFPAPNAQGIPEAVRITLSVDPNRKAREADRPGKDETRTGKAAPGEPPIVLRTIVRINLSNLRWETSSATANEGGTD